MRTSTRKKKTLDWRPFPDISKELPSEGNVYVSSLRNLFIADFVKAYGSKFSFVDLAQDNYETVFNGQDNSVLLYEQDIFPECPKIGLFELHERMQGRHDLEEFSRTKVFLCNDYATADEKALTDWTALIRKFDQGYESIYVLSADGQYVGTLGRNQFARCFLRASQAETQLISVAFREDEKQIKQDVAYIIRKQALEEVPVVDGMGQIKMSGIYGININAMGRKDIIKNQPIYWELISNEVFIDFFGRKKILISSEEGVLYGFRAQFQNMADITVYNGQDSFDEFDVVLYGANVWQNISLVKYDARQVYIDLLAEEMRRYFERNRISYRYCDVFKLVKNFKDRVTKNNMRLEASAPLPVWGGLREDYIVPGDNVKPGKLCVIGGRRQDSEFKEDYEKTVYVFGPCIAFGCSAPFDHTIEALLQKKLYRNGRRWRVVNCGSFGARDMLFNDLNTLYRMMATYLREGDVVLQFGQMQWRSSSAFQFHHIYYSEDVFDDAVHCGNKYWIDARSIAHLTAGGYEAWADFLARRLTNEELPLISSTWHIVQPFANRLSKRQVKNEKMRQYLTELAKHRHEEKGAIVMNANPFTLGHLFLVEKARQQCDFLYVFVVEEDKSSIPFADRLAIVKSNLGNLDNVEVLPSGRFMISALTFSEYFEKEECQEQTVLPTQDVVIFGEAIAPTLGITKRFVGEEPFDNITRQYNELMKQMLPDYGIELVEIPRKLAENGTAINATQVRAWMDAGDWEKCKAYLPSATLEYMKSKMRVIK